MIKEKIAKANSLGLLDINNLISYLEKTKVDSWATDVCRTQDGKNCLLGHVFEYGGGEAGQGTRACDWFEEAFATTYMFYPVNDGKHPNYQQSSPKERCIAYLKDLRGGKEKTTYQLMEEYR